MINNPECIETVEAGVPAAGRQMAAAVGAAVVGFFVVTLDATIVNVALPSIRNSLGGGITGLEWVVDGYTLMFAALLLSSGAISDRVGARTAFGWGMVVFITASAACGLAPNLPVLIAARFVQGAGAAVMLPSSLALIRHAHGESAARARAVGRWAMGGAVASVSGPFLGGLLTTVDWRFIFFINLPVGAVALLLLARAEPSPHHRVPFDWAGQLLGVVAMAGLTYGAIEAGVSSIIAPRVLAAFGIAVIASVAFLFAQARGRHPMVPLSMFRSSTVGIAMVVGFAFMVGYWGTPFVYSLYFQQDRGLSPLATGLMFLPMALIGLLLTPFSARIVERIGARPSIMAGLLFMAIGLVALSLVPPTTPDWALAALLVLVGLAGPLVMPPTTAALLASVSAHRAGTASGVFNTSRQVGGALAVAVFGALLEAPDGLRISLLLAAIVAIAAAVVSARLRVLPEING